MALLLLHTLAREYEMDALELLKQDHAKVKELLERAEGAEQGKEQNAIFNQIKKELETHARIEEDVFYPAVGETRRA
jgi:hemerythrin superfamily protein